MTSYGYEEQHVPHSTQLEGKRKDVLNTTTTRFKQIDDIRLGHQYHSHARGTLVTNTSFGSGVNVDFEMSDNRLDKNTLSKDECSPLSDTFELNEDLTTCGTPRCL